MHPDEVHVLRLLASGLVLVPDGSGDWSLARPGDDPRATWTRDAEPVPPGVADGLLEDGLVVESIVAGKAVFVATAAALDLVRRRPRDLDDEDPRRGVN